MLKMTYGAQGHLVYAPPDLLLAALQVWFAWLLLAAILFWRKPPAAVGGLMAIVIFYILALLQTNLSSELNTGFKHLGIQGRYLFPVLGPLYVLVASLLAGIRHRAAAGATTAATLLLFAAASPLWVLSYPAPASLPAPGLAAEAQELRVGAGQEVSQEFISDCPGAITRAAVMVGSSGATNPARLRLSDLDAGRVVAEQAADPTPDRLGTWLALPFPALEGTRGTRYRLTLSVEGEGTLPVWHTASNLYRFGDAFAGEQGTNYDLVFAYTCRAPALSDWFGE
jgi:hypothetical protein